MKSDHLLFYSVYLCNRSKDLYNFFVAFDKRTFQQVDAIWNGRENRIQALPDGFRFTGQIYD